MLRLPAAAPALVAVTLALGLAACSSSGGTSVTGTTVPGTTATPVPSTDVAATVAPPSGSISDLALKTATADVKITYASALGPTATLAQDGQGHSAFLSRGTLLISDGSTVISCTGTTAAAKCTDLGPTSSNDALTQIISSYAGLSNLKPNNLGETSTQTIAGRSASCVVFRAADYAAALGGLEASNKITAAAKVTICLDDDSGFALKIALTDRGQTVNEILATEVGAPSASDFVPPSTPVPVSTSPTAP